MTLKTGRMWDFLGGSVDRNLPANAGDMGSTPDPGRSHMPEATATRSLRTATRE